MKALRITTITTAALLAATLSGCGADSEPQAAPPASSAVEKASHTPTNDVAPETTTNDAAPATATNDPTPATQDLPTTVEGYAVAYLDAGHSGNEELLERMGTDAAIEQSVTWIGQPNTWEGPTLREGESGTVFLDYLGTPPNGLTLEIDRAAAEAGADDAVLSGELGDAPSATQDLPTTVEGYAAAYLEAGYAGNQELLERMGTDGAIEQSVTWIGQPDNWERSNLREVGGGIVWVEYLGEGRNGLSLEIDRAAAEAGAEDAVLSGELGDALPATTPEEYADEVVRLWPQDDAVWTGLYATEDVVEVLAAEPADGTWDRTDTTEESDGTVLVTYTNVESGRQLILTVDVAIVEARQMEVPAVIAAEVRD